MMTRLSDFVRRVYRRFFVTPNRKILWQITDKLDHVRRDATALSRELASVEKKSFEIAGNSKRKLQTALSEMSMQVQALFDEQRKLSLSAEKKLEDLDSHSEKRHSELSDRAEKCLSKLSDVTKKQFSELGAKTDKSFLEFSANAEMQFAELKGLMRQQLQATLINGREIERLQKGHHDSPPPSIKLSVIIPVYKDKYLVDCLDSVVHQDLESFEVICVDDGSTDRSAAIIEEYATKYPYVHAYHIINQGPGSARNYGLRHAHGEFIYSIDDDDLVKPNVFQQLYNEAHSRNLDILCFDGEPVYENTELEQRYPQYRKGYSLTRAHEYKDVYNGQDFLCKMKANGDYREVLWLQLFRNSFLKKHELTFPEGMFHEDTIFSFNCLVMAQRVSYKCINAYSYRVHNSSIMTLPLTEKNIYSTFRCYLEFARLSIVLPLTSETAEWTQKMLLGLRATTLKRYKQSGVQIDSCTEYFNAATRALFKTMILNQH